MSDYHSTGLHNLRKLLKLLEDRNLHDLSIQEAATIVLIQSSYFAFQSCFNDLEQLKNEKFDLETKNEMLQSVVDGIQSREVKKL